MRNVEKFVSDHGTYKGEEIPGFREFVVPAVEKLDEASKHLTAGAVSRYAFSPGVNLIGVGRVGLLAAIARRLCGIPKLPTGGWAGPGGSPASSLELESICREMRLDRTRGIESDPAPIESDRAVIEERLATGETDAWTTETLRRCLDILNKWTPVTITLNSYEEALALVESLKEVNAVETMRIVKEIEPALKKKGGSK